MGGAVTARYWVLCSDQLMNRTDLQWPAGLRPLERVCAEPGTPDAHWWRFEDDGAPESLEGTRVELRLGRREDGGAYIIGRRPA